MLERMAMAHQNDPDLVRDLLVDPGLWVVVGLSNNKERDAWQIARYLKVEQGKALIINTSRAEPAVTFTGKLVLPVVNRAPTRSASTSTPSGCSGAWSTWPRRRGPARSGWAW